MRFICKTNEPDSFTQWKQGANANWQPDWKNFQKPEKIDVHKCLLHEQGFTCCYCGQRISLDNSHIEHLQPRKSYPELRLEYHNFLASCPGYTEDPDIKPNIACRQQEFCGPKKDDWYDPELMVTPLMPNCAEYFRFTAAGEIRTVENPEKTTAANETIERLGLNHPKLVANRKKALEGILDGIEELEQEEIQQLITGYNQPNQDHQLVPLCAAIIYILVHI